MSERVDWGRMAELRPSAGRPDQGTGGTPRPHRRQRRRPEEVRLAYMAGLSTVALALAAYLGEWRWVVHSPLFGTVGAVVSELAVWVSWVVGLVWWLVTGDESVRLWAVSWFWHGGVQPLRSALGLLLSASGLGVFAAWYMYWGEYAKEKALNAVAGAVAALGLVLIGYVIVLGCWPS